MLPKEVARNLCPPSNAPEVDVMHSMREAAQATRSASDARFPSPQEDARRLAVRADALQRRGAVRDAIVAYDFALALLEGLPGNSQTADLLRAKGTLLREQGETAAAEALYRDSLAIAQNIRDTAAVAEAQNCLAIICQRRGEVARARQLFGDASLNAVAAGDRRLFATIERNLGALASLLGDADDAYLRYHLSLRAFREAGDEEGMTWVLHQIGLLHTAARRWTEAEESFARGLSLARARDDAFLEGMLELARAEMLVGAGRLVEAEEECQRALDLAGRRGDALRRAAALRLRATIERSRAELTLATEYLEEARALAERAEDVLLGAEVLREMGEVCLQRGDREGAREAWREALDGFRRLGVDGAAEELERRLSSLPA